MPNIQILLLAAGASRRMGKPKQLLPWKHTTLIEHQLQTLLTTNLSVTVVLGANGDAIEPKIAALPISICMHKHWKSGMGSSVAFGLECIVKKEADVDAVLIALVDQPLLTLAHFQNLLGIYTKGKKQISLSKGLDQAFGPPVIFDRMFFQDLLELKGDKGAKSVVQHYENHVQIVDAGPKLKDIDTPDVYKNLVENA